MRAEPPPSGYSVPPIPDAYGYVVPDLSNQPESDGYLVPDLSNQPESDGYVVPDLTSPAPVQNEAGRSAHAPLDPQNEVGGVAPELAPGPGPVRVPEAREFAMKPLGQEYLMGEKNTPSAQVRVGDQAVEVHEKDWLRQQHNEKRAAENRPAVTDEVWKAHVPTTQYMNDSQRAEHQVGFTPGEDGTGAMNAKVQGGAVKPGGEHLFVMDGAGEVYAKEAQAALGQKDSTGRGVHVHHSSFLAGEDVAGAGEMKVDGEGFLKEVTDRSGHYKPGEAQTTQTLGELENKGVNLNNVKFTLDRGTEKTGGMAREYQQGGEKVFQARHHVVDELKQAGGSVRDLLNREAKERAARVAQAMQGVEAGEPAARLPGDASADRSANDHPLKDEFKEALKDQLQEQKQDMTLAKSVRETTAKDLGNGYAAPNLGQSIRQ